MAAGHRVAAERADPLAHAPFVRGVSHREQRGHREGLDLPGELAHGGINCGFIQRLGLGTGGIVTAPHPHDDAPATALQTRGFGHTVVEAHENRADRTEPALDHRVGGQGSRNRDQ